MKCISLWEPWATLIAIGAKRIETRSWHTSYRGPLAIHAAKKIIPSFGEICHSEPFASALESVGYDEMECFGFGKVIAVVDLVGCKDITTAMSPPFFEGDWEMRSCMVAPPEPELSFGNYAAGRYGWLLQNVRKFGTAIPFRGSQRLFDVPDELIGDRG